MHHSFFKSLAFCVCAGVAFGLTAGVWRSQAQPEFPVPMELLHAATASGGNDANIAMATGNVDGEMEGVYVLDFLTGDLQCLVINPRNPAAISVFKYNVVTDLGVQQGKTPSYVMVTGGASFQRGAGAQPAGHVVYVADANTGNFAAYTFPWDRTASRGGQPQSSPLVRLTVGKFRNLGN